MSVRKAMRRGRVMWLAHVSVDGRERKRWCSRRDQAQQMEAQIRAELKAELSACKEEQHDKPKRIPTLSELWPDFQAFQTSSANRTPNRPRTAMENERTFRTYLAPTLGDMRVDAIGTLDIDRLAVAMADGHITGRQLKQNTVANALGLLRRMLSVARRWDYIDRVPEVDARKVKADKLEGDQWLTREETASTIEAATDRWKPAFLVAFRCGLRSGELRALRRSDLELGGGRLFVRQSYSDQTKLFGPPKGGRVREIPLAWDVAESLTAHADPGPHDGLLFTFGDDPTAPFHRNSFAGALRRAAANAGITKHVHPHMCRHSWTSHLVQAGVPSAVIMSWAGWTSEAMLRRYAHLRPDEVAFHIDKIAPTRPLRIVPSSAQQDPQQDPPSARRREQGA